MSNCRDVEVDRFKGLVLFWQIAVVCVAVVFVFGYFLWFFVIQGMSVSANTEAWGQFGDFIGGLVNPLIGFATFYWLTQSVKMQREELIATRHALEESSRSQAEQATHARTTVHLEALSNLIGATTAEIETRRVELQFLVQQLANNPGLGGRELTGKYLRQDEMMPAIKELAAYIQGRIEVMYELERRVGEILKLSEIKSD